MRIATPREAASGIYLFKATDINGKSAYYPLVLRSPRAATIAVVVPQFTWQAYNQFGGSSLYVQDPSQPEGIFVHTVSFERPYLNGGGAAELFDKSYSLELTVVRWLERSGYDVSYVSDRDLASMDQPLVTGARVFLFAGHDEYWTWREFDRVQRLRDSGHHLAFLSGNNAYWNVRLGAGRITDCAKCLITCYKLAPDPGAALSLEVTTKFRLRPLNRPENALIGVMYTRGSSSSGAPLVVADSNLGPAGRSFLAAGGLQRGDTIPGLIGAEGDQVVGNDATPRNLEIIFRSPAKPKSQDTSTAPLFYYTTFYVGSSGAGVFAAGSNDFARGLDRFSGMESPRIQAFTKAVLDWMLAH